MYKNSNKYNTHNRKINLLTRGRVSKSIINTEHVYSVFFIQLCIVLFFGVIASVIKNDLIQQNFYVWTDSLTLSGSTLAIMFIFRYKDKESYEKDRRELIKQIPILLTMLFILVIVVIVLAHYYEFSHFRSVHWHYLIFTYDKFLTSLLSNVPILLITFADTYLYFAVALMFTLIGYFTLVRIIGDRLSKKA